MASYKEAKRHIDNDIRYFNTLEACLAAVLFVISAPVAFSWLKGGCEEHGIGQTASQDTVQVVGYDPKIPVNKQKAHLLLIDKNGNLVELTNVDRKNSVVFEQGDTVVMKKSQIIKNLTQQRMLEQNIRASK